MAAIPRPRPQDIKEMQIRHQGVRIQVHRVGGNDPIEAGFPVSLHATAGTVVRATDAGAIGVVLASMGRTSFEPGNVVYVLEYGDLAGFDLSDIDYGTKVGVVDGNLDDDGTNPIGQVVPIWDQGDTTPKKHILINPPRI